MSNANDTSETRPRRFGQMLSQVVPLSDHDIDEILCEQVSTRRRFGDIALSLGLCRPEHVWEAWLAQADRNAPALPFVNLGTFGIDAQATSMINGEMAERLHVIPVRKISEVVIVAISSDADEADRQLAMRTVSSALRKQVRFVSADRTQIREAIERSYGSR